jgi:hypothetical protein
MNADHVVARFRVRWWMWPIGLLALLACAIGTVRWAGLASASAAAAEADAVGSAAAVLARLPAVDAGRQQRAHAALRRLSRGHGNAAGSLPFEIDPARVTRNPQQIKQQAESRRASSRVQVEEVAAMLAEGGVLLSTWVNLPSLNESVDIQQRIAETSLPMWMAVREAAAWWAMEAMEAADPQPALAALRDLEASVAHPTHLLDVFMAFDAGRLADQTRGALAMQGRLPDAELTRWLRTPALGPEAIADALTLHRVTDARDLIGLNIIEVHAAMTHPFSGSVRDVAPPLSWLRIGAAWTCLGFESAVETANAGMHIARLRGLPPPPTRAMPFGLPLALNPDSQSAYLTQTYATFAVEARVRRIVADIAMSRLRRGIAPADAIAGLADRFPAAWLSGPDAVGAVHLGGTRVRVGPVRTLADPPHTAPIRWTDAALEIDLAAMAIPPPPPAPTLPAPMPATTP